MAKEKTYDIDPADTVIFVFFADGTIARMVKTLDSLKSTYKFYLAPTKDFKQRYRERLEKDSSYDRTEDLYMKEIPKRKCILLDPHPMFQRWFILTNWWLEDLNIIDERMDELEVENKRLQFQRDSYARKIDSLNRSLSKMAKYPEAVSAELMKQRSREFKEFNLLNPTTKEGGET